MYSKRFECAACLFHDMYMYNVLCSDWGEGRSRWLYHRSLVAPVDVLATFTAADGDRVWSARPPLSPSLPQCLVSTQYCVLYAIMLGYYNLFCHVCEYHEVGIVK